MEKNRVLAIDQGTTGTTCLVVEFGVNGAVVLGKGYAEFPQHFPRPGWVEHDLTEIWDSTLDAVGAVLVSTNTPGEAIAAVGITNQRETTGVWDTKGRPLHNAIVWQDRRTADLCAELTAAGHAEMIRSRTGLVIDPYFTGTKIAWLLDNVPMLRQRASKGDVRFGTIDTWLVWKLTGGVYVTDATNASRTLLFDIRRNAWDDELCGIVGQVPRQALPEVAGSSEVYGKTKGMGVLPDGIPIAGIAGDQQAALFGQACFEPGMAKCTYGTGAFALVNIGGKPRVSESGLLTTIAWRINGINTYAIEGSAFIAGAVVQWLRDGLELFAESGEVEALAAQVPDSGGVTFVPALTGLGAPHWRPDARGIICGLTRGTKRAHIARAALEGIAFQISDLLEAMRRDSGSAISQLRVDGGACANEMLMQFQADLLGIEIHRPRVLETTALGAAYLAALAIGMFADLQDIASAWNLEKSYAPTMTQEAVTAKLAEWHQAVAKA
ncbi:MAG: glycerol kinase [Deltaproteobacteria bacterium RIFOXYA12_FULL_58_15]|nr:MAG: glycerol kinase [Deltaproteobacteria bacterium RIFOXYA12_FULL_58_15]OGR11006.1 MAG: glycerol kinase [Deltaproteobacteria bacterium RIFOXYB12_FULL_58_9]